VVTGANTGGSTTATLVITVNDVAPSSLDYTWETVVYTINDNVVRNIPTIGNGVSIVSYSVR
jgi:hypothetical protein